MHLENPLKTIHFILSLLKAFPNAYAQPAICGKVIKNGYYYQVTATNSKGTVTLLKRSFLVGILISSDQLTKTYNLKNIDAQVKFGSLPKGTYYYCVNATNKSVSTFFLGDTFTVS